MKIFFYTLALNERYYAQYAYNGLLKLGHEVLSKTVYQDDSLSFVLRVNEDSQILKLNPDLILFHGFSFMNHLKYQNLSDSKKLINSKIPYAVMWYDNPLRYLSDLKQCLETDYVFFCCDSEIVSKMIELGFTKTFHSPCMFDPKYQNLNVPVNPKMIHPISFAGTVLTDEIIHGIKSKLGIDGFGILEKIKSRRIPGQYQDYVSELNKEGIEFDHPDFSAFCHSNIMEQKHLLRMEVFEATRPIELHNYGQGNWQPKPGSNCFSHSNLNQLKYLPQLYRSAKIQLSVELLPSSTHQRLVETAACGGAFIAEKKNDIKNDFESSLVWDSLTDLKTICTELLKDDEKRLKYAKKLYEECQEKHRNDIRMKKNLEIILKS